MLFKTIGIRLIFFLTLFGSIVSVQGCAHSDVSRDVAGSIDKTYIGYSGTSMSPSSGNISNAYQNSSQKAKGVIIGGITGGVVGGFSNGVGAGLGAALGAVLGGSLGAYIDAHTTLIDKLKNRGVKVFVLGDQVLIVIPSNRLFAERSPIIDCNQYTTLDLIAELIGNYVNMTVHVAAYTNAVGSPDVDLAFTKQQANNVARYLWKRCVNTRLLFAEGYGATHLVTRNNLNYDCNDNYRIEITFEKLPVC